MAISNKFLHFSTRNGFLKEIANYVTFTEPSTYVVKSGKETDWNYFKNFTVFIKDTQQIWTREQFYNCSVSLDTVMKGSQYLIDYNNENQKVGVAFDGTALTSGTASFIAAYKRVPKTGLIAGIQPMSWAETAKGVGTHANGVRWYGTVTANNIVKLSSGNYYELTYLDRLQEETTRNNAFAFLNPNAITLEYSNDAGETWTEYQDTSDNKAKNSLFSVGNYWWKVGNRTQSVDTLSTNDKARCTIDFTTANFYGRIDQFVFYVTTAGNVMTCDMDVEYTGQEGTWKSAWKDQALKGSNGFNVFNVTSFLTQNNGVANRVLKLRLTVNITSVLEQNKTNIPYILQWKAYGSIFYRTPSTLAKNGHLYNYNYLKDVTFPRNIYADGYYIQGSSGFLKANGSVDNSTYLTTSGNAASSTKLQTARKLWGQSFNGTADISGAITSSGLVTATGFKITGKTGFLKADGTVDTTTYLSSVPISTASTVGGIKSQIVSATTSLTETTHTKLPVIVNSDGTAYSELKNTNLPNIPASLLTGTIDIERLPQGALERLAIVADETARFALTTDTVQNGDTVKQTDTEQLYFVVDDTKLNSEDGYEPYSTGKAASVEWAGITGKPSWIKDTKPSYNSTEISGGWVTTSNAYWGMAQESYVQSSDTISQAINRVEWRAEHGPKINGHKLEATYGGSWTFDSDCMNITFELEDPDQYLHFNAKPATSSSYGMIKVGTGLSISNGVLSVNGTLLTTSAQTITGIKTFKNTIIGTSTENTWATSYNYQKAALGVLQSSKDALCTALCLESAETSKRYFNISTFGNRLLISASTEKDNWNHNWADGGIFIQTNGCTTVDNGTWTFGGFTSYPDSPAWTINEKGVFSGTARNCGLITATLSNKIEAGYTYNNTTATAISTFSGFSELKPDATVISTKKITFSGSNIIKSQYLDDLSVSTNQYIIYTLSYMPNGKIAINGSIYE